MVIKGYKGLIAWQKAMDIACRFDYVFKTELAPSLPYLSPTTTTELQ